MGRSLREIFNEGNPNKVPAANQDARMGSRLAVSPRYFRGPVVNDELVLPEDARASALVKVYTTAGTTTGEFTIIRTGDTPTAGQAAINAVGNVAFLPADAITEAEVNYIPHEGSVVEDTISVATNLGTLLASRKAQVVLEAEAIVGGSVGPKAIVNRGATPAAGQAALEFLGDQVEFAGADSVTQARVKYIAAPGEGNEAGPLGTELDAETKDY